MPTAHFVSPNIHWITLPLARLAQKFEPDRCADLGHRSEKRGRDDPILEALYLRETDGEG